MVSPEGVFYITSLIIFIGLAIWVSKDAKNRGKDGFKWFMISFLLGIFGIIVWIFSRPKIEEKNKKKKAGYITAPFFLILSWITYIGCYYWAWMTPYEYDFIRTIIALILLSSFLWLILGYIFLFVWLKKK